MSDSDDNGEYFDIRAVMRIQGAEDFKISITCDDDEVLQHDTEGRRVIFIVNDNEYGVAAVSAWRPSITEDWMFTATMLPEHRKNGAAVLPMTVEIAEDGSGLSCAFPLYSTGCTCLLVDRDTEITLVPKTTSRSLALN